MSASLTTFILKYSVWKSSFRMGPCSSVRQPSVKTNNSHYLNKARQHNLMGVVQKGRRDNNILDDKVGN